MVASVPPFPSSLRMEELAFPLLSPTDEGALEVPFSFPDDDATALVRPEASDTLCILLGSGVGLDGPLSELILKGDTS